MDGQIISTVKGKQLDQLKAKGIGRDLELSQPTDIDKIEYSQNSMNESLSEFAKKIVYLSDDKKRKIKILNLLVTLKEVHPNVDLNEFVKTFILNNGASTSKLIEETESLVTKVNNLDTAFSSKESKKLEARRNKMIKALSIVGVNYKKQPTIEVLSQDFKNVIIDKAKRKNSLDWGSITDTITNITDTTTNISNGIGSVIGNVNQISDLFKSRPDTIYTPPSYSSGEAEKIYIQSESKSQGNEKLYIFGGLGVVALIIVLVLMLKN